ncbi:MAG: amidase [Alphaproteobacteria bacterium]|nr:amidase [Alphaproteobacteria bacterium]MBU0795613.1 amidase [Alphaproteobacteria bacterium]MBU0887670.1 amidase [Alphaproteobacteria bacterium]MBU1812903.1 amidase [Alphaproteobacteria bacterium]MBU2088976.1 amidase [Alphaproteobacteria bacterium]
MTNKNDDICYLSATELLRHYQRKTLSPVEVTKAVLGRIEAVNPHVNAFCLVDPDAALAAARNSEARWMQREPRGMVDGIPATVKDLILSEGWPTLRGSKTVDTSRNWGEDAPSVARLREEGAVLVGKTTTPEYGWKGVTDSPLTGITRNPWDTSKTPGGSSGGAAAAAALGMGCLHIGTDGGGSIRMPSGFTGIFGLKAHFGRVPAFPASPMGTLSHVGPMTRTVADTALMMNVMAMPDARDWFALPYDGRDYRIGLEDGVEGLRIGFSAALGYASVDPEIAHAVKKAVEVFVDLGAEVDEVDPGFENPADIFRTLWYFGAANMYRKLTPEQRRVMDPGLVEVAEEGLTYSAEKIAAATEARAVLGLTMNLFHETYDLLLTPTLPLPAFEAGLEFPDGKGFSRWPDWAPFSHPFNLTQQPAASVPCGFTKAGLPIGLQIVGPSHGEALVLQAARAYEAAHPFVMPREANVTHK